MSKKSILLKVLWSKSRQWNFMVAGAGFVLGLVIIMISVQLYTDLNLLIKKQNRGNHRYDYLILNKEVSAINALNAFSGNMGAQFSKKEIEDLQKQPFIEAMSPVIINEFPVSSDLPEKMNMYADLFFESVPDAFMDTLPPNWKWDETKGFLPVIMSKEWLNLYNFNVANMYGLPQLSEEGLQSIEINLVIGSGYNKRNLKAKIAGFSYRLPSLMVPVSFMEWANKNYGNKPQQTHKVIIAVQDASSGELKKYLKKKHFQANVEKLFSESFREIASIAYSIAFIVGGLFALLAILVFIMSLQLLLNRGKTEVQLAIDLGYRPHTVNKVLTTHFAKYLVFTFIFSLLLFFACFFLLKNRVLLSIPDFDIHFSVYPLLALLFIEAATLMAGYFSIRKQIKIVSQVNG
jgi:hypothetical protein